MTAAMERRRTRSEPNNPRLILVTPAIEDAAAFVPALAAARAAADIAAVILRLAPGTDAEQLARIAALAPAARNSDAALLLEGRADLVAASGADGVHLHGSDAIAPARATLGPDRIVGAGGLATRHDAMLAGEANADYVLFGDPDANRRPAFPVLLDRVSWWAELFVIPCIGYAATQEEIAPLVQTGTDYVALGEEAVWNAPEGPATALAAASKHLAEREPA
jgi:thiamine-phosphate pyrophosphorylase